MKICPFCFFFPLFHEFRRQKVHGGVEGTLFGNAVEGLQKNGCFIQNLGGSSRIFSNFDFFALFFTLRASSAGWPQMFLNPAKPTPFSSLYLISLSVLRSRKKKSTLGNDSQMAQPEREILIRKSARARSLLFRFLLPLFGK